MKTLLSRTLGKAGRDRLAMAPSAVLFEKPLSQFERAERFSFLESCSLCNLDPYSFSFSAQFSKPAVEC